MEKKQKNLKQRIKTEMMSKKKYKVNCFWCKKELGTRIGLRYNVINGTIQEGRGKGKPYFNFCSEKCKFLNWLNCWADFNKHEEGIKNGYFTDFGRGYNQAVSDIWEHSFIQRLQKGGLNSSHA